MRQRRPLPDRPRLLQGVEAFPAGEALIVRTVVGAVQIPRSYRNAIEQLLPRLDGHYTYQGLLGDQAGRDGLYALGLLSWLAEQGALADGPPARACATTRTEPRLDGVELDLLDSGPFANALRAHLCALGAKVAFSTIASPARLALACPDGPALGRLEALNQKSCGSWLAIFPFGDGIVISPVFAADHAPCFRCFELRWLGISPSVALEVSYFERVRLEPPQLITRKNADAVAASVIPLIATRLTGARPGASVMLMRVDSGELSESQLEPCPHCEVCGEAHRNRVGPEPVVHWNDHAIPLDELVGDLERVAGSPCGLAVLWERDEDPHTSGAPMHVVVSRFSLPEPEKVVGAQENWAHGTGDTPEAARAVALIEALERYGGLSVPPPGVWGSYSELRADAILPTELPLFAAHEYSRRGFPFEPFDPDRETRWNWAFNLTQQRRVLVPTSAVWYGYDDWLLGESSNGVAAHSSRGCALRNAALELVERDAFMIHWLHRLSPPRLGSVIVSERRGRLIDWVERSGYVVHLRDLSTNLRIPVVLAIGVHEERSGPALLVGAGAALSPYEALDKALSELYSATFSAPAQWMLKRPLDPTDIAQLGDHARAFTEHPEWLRHASFLWSSETSVDWSAYRDGAQTDDELRTITELLRLRGHDLIGINITGKDVARHNLQIVRAIVPGLQPLALGSRARLGGRRLFEAPREMGYADAAGCAEDLNPIPHCFP